MFLSPPGSKVMKLTQMLESAKTVGLGGDRMGLGQTVAAGGAVIQGDRPVDGRVAVGTAGRGMVERAVGVGGRRLTNATRPS